MGDAYRLREARPEDVEAIVDFISEHFVHGQPINLAISLCSEGYRMPYYDAWMRSRLSHPGCLTVIAESTASGKELLGVVFAMLHPKDAVDDHVVDPDPYPDRRTDRKPERFQKIVDLLIHIEALGIEAGERKEEWNRAEIEILCCRHGGQRIPGLGTALVKKIVSLGWERGMDYQVTVATGAYSARIFEKLGFQEVVSLSYADYKEDGKVVFAMDPPHTHCKLLVLKKCAMG